MRKCTKCGLRKHWSAFYKQGQGRPGRIAQCKECTKSAVRTHRSKNIDRIRAYDRERGTRLTAKQQREHRARYPNKYKARTAVGNAIRDGRLHRETCSSCGSVENVHAHHHDYSKPLDVKWLCRPCHWSEHRKYP